ncbi:unnamed protein product, partial [Porites evermanni]
TVLVSVWIISCVLAIQFIFFPKEIEMVAVVICLIGYLQNAQTREAHRQRKSASNSLFVSVVLLACYFPSFPCTILYETNTSDISFLVARLGSVFLICLNSSLNPIVYCWRYREIRQSVKSTL